MGSSESVMVGAPTNTARPLKILHVVPTYYPAVRYGGPIRSVHGLAVALAGRGHEVHAYASSMDGDQDLDVPLDSPVDLQGVAVRYFRVPALRRLCWAPALARRLRKSIADFDVVNLHSVYLWPTFAAARAAAGAHVPYVISPHGMLSRDLIRRKSRWAKTAWINLVERPTLARAAALHVTAELERDEVFNLQLPLPDIVAAIPNGIEFPASHLPISATPFAGLPRPYALFLSRINWKKGLEQLITAWQWVPRLPLVIAGTDEGGYQAHLEGLVHSLGIGDRVRFIGPVADQDKWALYEQAELFLLPSLSENFAMVVAEAMGVGCPVIVTPDVGLARFVQEHGAGIVVSNEPAKLAETVNSLLADESRRRELGRRGREAARSRLAWSAVIGQMEDLYFRAIERHAAVAGVSVGA
jgi:glycosyltransferase involved in cell wall biosynthesis